MTDREKYDALAAQLKTFWGAAAADDTMTESRWYAATLLAKAGEDQLRAIFP